MIALHLQHVLPLSNQRHQGIDGFVINYFFRAIVKLLQSKGRYQR